jgi:hypothetical protein
VKNIRDCVTCTQTRGEFIGRSDFAFKVGRCRSENEETGKQTKVHYPRMRDDAAGGFRYSMVH